MKRALILTSTLLYAQLAISADIAAGEEKAGVCTSCHGKDGVGTTELYPNLAGQKAAYLKQQLQAYQDGKRKDPSMAIFAKQLSDEDIVNIAAYYESLPAGGAKASDK